MKVDDMELDTIYNADCMEGMEDIPNGSVDMVLCDLPYGTTKNRWDSCLPLDALWAHYRRVVKPGGMLPFRADTLHGSAGLLQPLHAAL